MYWLKRKIFRANVSQADLDLKSDELRGMRAEVEHVDAEVRDQQAKVTAMNGKENHKGGRSKLVRRRV